MNRFENMDALMNGARGIIRQLEALRSVREENFVDIPAEQKIQWHNLTRKWAWIIKLIAICCCIIVCAWFFSLLVFAIAAGKEHVQIQSELSNIEKRENNIENTFTAITTNLSTAITHDRSTLNETLLRLEMSINTTRTYLQRLEKFNVCVRIYLSSSTDDPIYKSKFEDCISRIGNTINTNNL